MLAILAAVSAVGCNKSPFELAPVSGTVTVDGRPLGAGRVMFAPIANGDRKEAGKAAFGTLQADGRFTLTTFRPEDGAIIGEHWVTIFGPKKGSEATENSTDSSIPSFTRYAFPRKQLIAAGQGNQIDLPISSAEIARRAAHN